MNGTATCLIAAGHDGNHAGNDIDGRWLRWTDEPIRFIDANDPDEGVLAFLRMVEDDDA